MKPKEILIDPSETEIVSKPLVVHLFKDAIFTAHDGNRYCFWSIYSNDLTVIDNQDIYIFIKERIDNFLLKVDKNGLVKIGDHYEYWNALFYSDTLEEHEKHNEDTPVHIKVDDLVHKYAITFSAADVGGYDCEQVTYYYDSIEKFIKECSVPKTK